MDCGSADSQSWLPQVPWVQLFGEAGGSQWPSLCAGILTDQAGRERLGLDLLLYPNHPGKTAF